MNLESITVTDQDSTEVDIGTFNPDVNSYSANVASSVEHVTISYAASDSPLEPLFCLGTVSPENWATR